MQFAHDTKLALLATAAFVNTTPDLSDSGTDEMAAPDHVLAFVEEHDYSGSVRGDQAEIGELQAVRQRLRQLWELCSPGGEMPIDVDGVVEVVNAFLREYDALPQLVRHDGWDWHVHAVSTERPLADRICVEAALAVIDLIRAEELRRMRRCAADDCDAVFIDLSRNRSKRYCDVGNCGNRAHVAAYRSRQAGT